MLLVNASLVLCETRTGRQVIDPRLPRCFGSSIGLSSLCAILVKAISSVPLLGNEPTISIFTNILLVCYAAPFQKERRVDLSLLIEFDPFINSIVAPVSQTGRDRLDLQLEGTPSLIANRRERSKFAMFEF
jgi:hypothetical protein